jgi:uncharacterized membrane protein
MKQKFQKIFKYLLIVIFIFLFIQVASAKGALITKPNPEEDITQDFVDTTGFNQGTSVGNIVATGIEIVLSVLGLIFVVLVIVSGFEWMTASGSEDRISKAKKRLTSAIIGLVIVIAAYSITWFIFTKLPFGSGGSGGVIG